MAGNLKQERVILVHGSEGFRSPRLVDPMCWGAASWWEPAAVEHHRLLPGQQETRV